MAEYLQAGRPAQGYLPGGGGEVKTRCTTAEALAWIKANCNLRLKGVAWPLDDDTLVERAGACAACPKRSGNAKDLFTDVKNPNVCTDPGCFEKKREAHKARLRAEYEAKAKASLDDAESRKAKLEGAEVTIHANAATEGKLYGSVTNRDIAEALTKAGYEVEKSEVILGEGAFRHTGEYEVLLHLHADVETTVKVIVAPEAA